MDSIISADESNLVDDFSTVEYEILSGKVVILFSNDPQFIAVNLRKVEHRNVSPPELMYSFRGGRDAFVEDIDTNLSLLRYRIKDTNIRIENMEAGKRTRSRLAVVYIEDIANPEYVDEVKKRINQINTDGIYESGELKNFLQNKKGNLFPQAGMLERSDMAVDALLEGKLVLLIDGSSIALEIPKVFVEFLYSCDDRYEVAYFGVFMRIIRYLAFIIAISFTSFYIALGSFHLNAMLPAYLVQLAQMRSRSLFNTFISVLVLEFIVEMIREALFRVPQKVGSAIGIVGAIIIGQAAIASGIFSPILLIIVSMSLLASFAVPDMSLMNAFRILKFMLIFMTGFLGFYGLILGITLILANLVSNNSFGVPYMAPYAPFNSYDFWRSLLFNRSTSPKRQKYMRNNDETRS